MNPIDFNKHLKNGRMPSGSALKAVPPGTPIQVDLKHATKLTCPCGGTAFIPAIEVYKVSALISPTGQELIANQQVIICSKCSEVYKGE